MLSHNPLIYLLHSHHQYVTTLLICTHAVNKDKYVAIIMLDILHGALLPQPFASVFGLGMRHHSDGNETSLRRE